MSESTPSSSDQPARLPGLTADEAHEGLRALARAMGRLPAWLTCPANALSRATAPEPAAERGVSRVEG